MNEVVELTLDQELDAVLDMSNSTGWAVMMQEAEAMYNANQAQLLESVDDMHALGLTQGFCRALAWLSNYPELKRTVIEQAQEEDNE